MNALRSRGLKVAVASSSAAPDIMKMLTEGGLKAMVDLAYGRRGLRRP
jgi:beta-phosphoglucomutase-like phosphatase (HAD superfamily)